MHGPSDPVGMHRSLPKCLASRPAAVRVSDWAQRGAAHCGQEPWYKGSREAVGRQERERDAAAMVAVKAREQENSCLAAIELAHTCKVASGISPVLVSCFLAAHARVNLPGIVAPLLVDEPVQPPDWDSGTSREAVERRTICPSEVAGCWEGSEGGKSCEERGDCTPAWSPFASEAPAAARRRAAITLVPVFLSAGFGFCSLQHLSTHQADLAALQA